MAKATRHIELAKPALKREAFFHSENGLFAIISEFAGKVFASKLGKVSLLTDSLVRSYASGAVANEESHGS